MARDFGHEDAGLATKASPEEITRTPSVDTILETNDKLNLAWTAVWKHSILRSVLHHVKDHISVEGGSSLDNDRIGHLVEIKSLGALRPFHYYRDITHALDSAPHKTLDKIRAELFELDQILQYSNENVHPHDHSGLLRGIRHGAEKTPGSPIANVTAKQTFSTRRHS